MRKRFGQHFLHDKGIARKIVEAAMLGPGDRVLEIGPGRGELTGFISEAAGEVSAVEIDLDLCRLLDRKFKGKENVRIIRGNFLDKDLKSIFPEAGTPVKVLGNIPYYITTPIIEKLFGWRDAVDSAVITVQKEVAERMCAGPGSKKYGALSVFVACNSSAQLVRMIKRDCFSPPPEVDSAVVRLVMREDAVFPGGENEFFSRFVKSMFAQKRKMVHNALRRAASLEKDEADAALARAGIDGSLRPERIPFEQYVSLFKILGEPKE